MATDLNVSPSPLDSGPLAEISQGPNAFEAFLDRHQKSIALLAILLVIAVIALVIYRGVKTSHAENAGTALAKAEDLAGFQAVVNDHAATAAASSAMILLANSQWDAGKKDDATRTLQAFISANPKHPAFFTAKANLGAKLMAQGKSDDATKVFEELVADPAASFIAPFAMISLGDISKASGNIEKAEASYNDVKSKFPDSSFVTLASQRLGNLKAKAPVEIEPPVVIPPPAAAPAPNISPTETVPPLVPNP